MVSRHYKEQRDRRERFIKECLGGDGKIVDSFVIDKGHPMGAELHCITNNGIIIIYNVDNGKLCSKLIARENQIKRYYRNCGREPPDDYEKILEIARLHETLGYNYI